MAGDCIFCRIAAGEIPGEILHQDEQVVAFSDIRPQAPVHVLIIPREHVAGLVDIREGHQALIGRIFQVANGLAERLGIRERGYRVVVNHGPDAGQTVFHVHFHLLGGRSLGWPPG